MFGPRDHETGFQHWVRIVARILAVFCLSVIVLYLLGEGIAIEQIGPRDWVGLLFFPIGVFVGLVLSWHEELLGGTITVLSIAGFYIVYGWLLNSSIKQGWAFLLFSIPGLLFMVYGMFGARKRHATAS